MEKAAGSPKFRFERKFVISGLYNRELETMIRMHPALFSEIFHERQVNNIYFDTYDFRNYWDNIDGCAERVKVRIRWYGPLFGMVEKPVLEFKIKNALQGKKLSYHLKGFPLQRGFNFQTIIEAIRRSEIPGNIQDNLKNLQPVLLNRYRRRYFLSADKRYRITMDKEMEYYRINKINNFFINKYKDADSTIIELKYPSELDHDADMVSTLFSFRMTKSSKYVNGIDRFYGSTV